MHTNMWAQPSLFHQAARRRRGRRSARSPPHASHDTTQHDTACSSTPLIPGRVMTFLLHLCWHCGGDRQIDGLFVDLATVQLHLHPVMESKSSSVKSSRHNSPERNLLTETSGLARTCSIRKASPPRNNSRFR